MASNRIDAALTAEQRDKAKRLFVAHHVCRCRCGFYGNRVLRRVRIAYLFVARHDQS